jgi:hypothetical protein
VEISVTTKGGCSVRLIFGKEEIKDMTDVLLNRLNTCSLTVEMENEAVS